MSKLHRKSGPMAVLFGAALASAATAAAAQSPTLIEAARAEGKPTLYVTTVDAEVRENVFAFDGYTPTTAAAIAALLILIVFPIARMLGTTFFRGGTFNLGAFADIAREPWLAPALVNTLIAVGVSTIIAVLAAAGSAVGQVGRDLREASSIAGAGQGRTIRRIVVPLAVPGFAAGWTLVFVDMTGDLSASAPLAGVGTPVTGFAIPTIWATGSLGRLAAFSAIMCLINAIVVGDRAWLVKRLTTR